MYALVVERSLNIMAKPIGNIAAASVISRQGSEANAVTDEQFRNEKLYETTLHIVNGWRKAGLVSEREVTNIVADLQKKYNPIFAGLPIVST